MFEIFKEKLLAEEAVAVYLNMIAKEIKECWHSDVTELNDLLQREVLSINQEQVKFELFLAVIALELSAVMNLKPEKYDLIYKSLMKNLDNEDSIRDYAIETINEEYLPAIRRAELKNIPPYNDLLFIFIDKCNLPDDMISATLISNILLSKLGTWKLIFDKYRIV